MKQEEFDLLAKVIDREELAIAQRLDQTGGAATQLLVGVVFDRAFDRIKDAARNLIDARRGENKFIFYTDESPIWGDREKCSDVAQEKDVVLGRIEDATTCKECGGESKLRYPCQSSQEPCRECGGTGKTVEHLNIPKFLATTPETVAALKELLQLNASRGVVVVDFIKTDGTPRTMHCTLNSETNPMLAEDRRIAAEKERKPRAENLGILSVWDIQKNGWRSFRIDSVTGYKTIN